jgi:hypothetical protein
MRSTYAYLRTPWIRPKGMSKWNYEPSFTHLMLGCIAGSVSKADTKTRVEARVKTRVEPTSRS